MALTAEETSRLNQIDEALRQRQVDDELSPAGVDIRLNSINEELIKRGEPIVDSQPALTDDEQFEVDEEIMSLANNPKVDFADPNDLTTFRQELLQDPDVIQKDKDIEKQGFIDTFKELKEFDSVAKRLPIAGSVYKISRTTNLMRAVQLLNSGKTNDRVPTFATFNKPTNIAQRDATEQEKKDSIEFIVNWMQDLEKAQNKTRGGKFANALLEMPAFITEFILTGPIFKTGSAAAKATATRLLGKMAESGTKRFAIRAAGAGFGSIARTAVNVPRVLEGSLDRMTRGISVTDDGAVVFADAARNPFTALAGSFTDLFIENLTEVAGGAIGEGFSFVGKGIAKKFPVIGKFTKELAEKWVANAPKGVRTLAQFAQKANTKIGFDGILQEFGEERLGDVLRVATGLQDFDQIVPSFEDMLIEAGVLITFGGVSLASSKIFRGDEPAIPPTTDLTEVSDTQFDEAIKSPFIDISPEIKKQDATPAQKLNASTKAKALDGNAKAPPVVEPAGPIKRAIVRNIARAEDAAGTWGKTGLKVQKDLREIAFRTAVNTGNTTQNIKPLTKGLTKAEKTIVAQLIDGAIPESNQPHRLTERANLIKAELDVIQNEAISIGLRRGGLTGKAFPQVLNKEGREFLEEAELNGPKSSKVFAWAQNQVKEGKFKTVDDAIIALERYRSGLISGKEGYIEGARTLDIGPEFRDWNLDKILSGTIESSWEKIEAARQWGVVAERKDDAGEMLLPFKDIQIDIAKLRADVGNNEATALNEYLKAQYGRSKADTAIIKVTKAARTTQFVGKLAFSPLTITRNILDRYAKGLSHGTFFTNARAAIKYPPFLNNWMESARNIEDQMIRSGAVLGHGHLSEGFTAGEGALAFAGKLFGASEKGNQTYIALIKKLQLESDVKRLMQLDGREGVTSKVFDRMATFIGQSQSITKKRVLTDLTNDQLADALASEGQIPDDVMAEVLHRTVTDSAFPLTLASKRLWWNQKPILQAATQFKVWSADQTRFIYKDVLKYGIQTGDYSRLARFMVGTWLMGELYNIARDEITNKDESALSKLKGGTRTEIAMSIGKDLIDGGVVGMLADFTYGIGDWAAGPTTNSITGVATAIDQARGTATLPQALGQFLLEDIPALRQAQGVIDNLDSIFNKNNLTENYARWQGRSFDFRRKNGESATDIIGNRFIRSLRGTPQKRVTERSLSLNLVARQVLVGDYDDAAQHIKRVMLETKVEDIKSTVQSFKQSMNNNSPFGNIADKDIGLFLAQFSPDEANKGIDLQGQWLKGYAESLKTAFNELKAGGFVEDSKAKAEAYKEEMQPRIEKARKRIAEIKKLRRSK